MEYSTASTLSNDRANPRVEALDASSSFPLLVSDPNTFLNDLKKNYCCPRKMETSLMAFDGDPGAPLLADGPPIEEESEFARLIAQNHTIDEHLIHGFHRLMPEELSRSLNFETQEGGFERRIVVIDDKPRSALSTAVAGTLGLVHLGLVWGAFTATAWSETHVTFEIGWQKQYLPFLSDFTDQVIRTNSLASLLQDLDECKAYVLLVLIWTTAMVIPCLFMVLSPTLVVGDYLRPIELRKRRVIFDGRTFLELVFRFSWLPVFTLSFVSLSTSAVELEWTQTTIKIGQQLKGPFAAYLFGTLCGVGLLALLRTPREESFRIVTESREIEFSAATPNVRSPPPQAFRHAWDINEDEDIPLMTVLEEEAASPPPRPSGAAPPPQVSSPGIRTGASTPELIDEDTPMEQPQYPPRLTYWNKFTVFQVGLMSVIFWIPAFYLPLLHVSYTGIASDFVKQHSFRIFLWEFPKTLWVQGTEFGTSGCILALLGPFLMFTVIIIPMLATFQGVLAWLGEGGWSTRSYVWLYALHPYLGGVVFCLALMSTVPSLSSLSALVYDEQSSMFCHGLNGTPCLEAHGQMLSGAFFYLAQALCLEVFVLLTLRWSRRQ